MNEITLNQIYQGMKKGNTLYYIYADWCGYTQLFQPIYNKTIEQMKKEGTDKRFDIIKLNDVSIAQLRKPYIAKKTDNSKEEQQRIKVLETKRNDILNKLESISFPTVLMFVDGVKHKYESYPRTEVNFKQFIVSTLAKSKQQGTRGTKNTKRNNSSQQNKVLLERNKQQNEHANTFNKRKLNQRRPVRVLTLQEQIDNAFKKMFK